MAGDQLDFEHLGRRVRQTQDAGIAQRAQCIHEARTGFLHAFEERSLRGGAAGFGPARRRSTGRVFVAAGASAAALAVGLFAYVFVLPTRPDHLTATPHRSHPGELLEAPFSRPMPVELSRDAAMVLAPASRARILGASKAKAGVRLESGQADVKVVPGGRRRWRFEAGPYDIAVKGTRFAFAFTPAGARFWIRLGEGSVVVSSRCAHPTRHVKRGEQLSLDCPNWSDGEEHKVAMRVDRKTLPAERAVEPAREAPGVARATRAPARRSASKDWHALHAAGQYSEALAAAERAGFDRLCATLGSGALSRLADTARYAGSRMRARSALRCLRSRFAGSPSAALAAYQLGRIAFEAQGDYRGAARWFATYVYEQPNGPLIGDALGRLLEAHHKAGDRAQASKLARRYLQRYPKGPYAPLGHAVLAD